MMTATDKIEHFDIESTGAFLPTDTAYKAVDFIQTYTGRAFWPLKPTVEALSIIDIAHALANQCRYSGHVRYFYSTAQHCCLLAKHCIDVGHSPLVALQILMHDAAEAYLVDIPRPVKQFMPEYRVWDHNINTTIREWMGWSDLPLPPFQDDLDSRIIVDERAALMDEGNYDHGAARLDWQHAARMPVGVIIEQWTPEEAEKQFLMQYAAYSREVYGTPQYLNAAWKLPYNVLYDAAGQSADRASDLIEVDIRGNVARIRTRGDDGILVRDPAAGTYPRPKWEWWHGTFQIQERAA